MHEGRKELVRRVVTRLSVLVERRGSGRRDGGRWTSGAAAASDAFGGTPCGRLEPGDGHGRDDADAPGCE
jgi:hypothetical protein